MIGVQYAWTNLIVLLTSPEFCSLVSRVAATFEIAEYAKDVFLVLPSLSLNVAPSPWLGDWSGS